MYAKGVNIRYACADNAPGSPGSLLFSLPATVMICLRAHRLPIRVCRNARFSTVTTTIFWLVCRASCSVLVFRITADGVSPSSSLVRRFNAYQLPRNTHRRYRNNVSYVRNRIPRILRFSRVSSFICLYSLYQLSLGRAAGCGARNSCNTRTVCCVVRPGHGAVRVILPAAGRAYAILDQCYSMEVRRRKCLL